MPLELLPSRNIDLLLPFLLEADEDVDRISDAILDNQNKPYLLILENRSIGAVLIHWHQDESELIYIGIDRSHRGQGYGKAAMSRIITMARERSVMSLIVGTANSGLENIIFYQKCGFRIDSVRKDYFNYFPAAVYEHGVQIRDMLVLRYEFD